MFYHLASRWGPGELDQICWSELDFGSQLISASGKAGGVPGYPRWSQTQRLHCFQKPSRPSNIFKHYANSQAPGYTIRDRGFKRISKALLCPPSEFWQNHPKSHFAFDFVSCGSILLVFGLLFLGGGYTVDPALSCLGRPVDTFILRPGDFFQVHKLLFGSLQHPKRRRASHSSRNLHEGVI